MRLMMAALLLVTPAPSTAAPGKVCDITDPRVTEVSGIVATAGGYIVENDGNIDTGRVKLFTLDRSCAVTKTVSYPRPARDPEDLAMDRAGTLWVADIGDNSPLAGGSGNRRSTIALWTLPAGAQTPVIHRLVYPDGRPRDAEALLIDGSGRPVIITKDPVGEVYVLEGPLPADNTTGAKLTRVGSFTPSHTGTDNPLGFLGSALITGAALSPDGSRAVIRTYADAYEFDVTGGDVLAAITTGTPRVTPLPNEPQGEGIAYSPDGNSFLTVSDQPESSSIMRYIPNRPAAVAPQSGAPASATPAHGAGRRPDPAPGRTFLLVAVFAVVGLMLVGSVYASVRFRKGSKGSSAAKGVAPRRE